MSTATASHADIKDMTFERALKELETIVSRLERGDVELEESILIYERGEALKEHCDRLLKQAEAKVEKLRSRRRHEGRALDPQIRPALGREICPSGESRSTFSICPPRADPGPEGRHGASGSCVRNLSGA
jgi:exodeoxyribonuclease VII small subunit